MPKPNNPRNINWYRTSLTPEQLKGLNKRSDLKGLAQAMSHIGILAVTSTATFLAWQHGYWGLMIIALFLHGTAANFYINAVHELVHGTVFKNKWLNDVFVHLFAFPGWINHYFFWGSHTEHHKYTLHNPDDMEVVLPITHTFDNFLKTALVSPMGIKWTVEGVWGTATGKIKGEWAEKLFPESYPEGRAQVINWARTLLIGHGLIAVVSIATGYWIIPILVSCSTFFGGWLFWLCNNTQHVGLVDSVPDFRLCCRTISLHWIPRTLYWHMNYHTEHHMFAAVPCYNLKKCHDLIKHELPPTKGLMEAWYEIITICKKQKDDPTYQYMQPLPDTAPPITVEPPLNTTEPIMDTDGVTPLTVTHTNDAGYTLWECTICGFIYDEAKGLPEEGLAPGTRWNDIPDDWACPDCGVSKSEFDMRDIGPSPSAQVSPNATEQQGSLVIVGSGLGGYTLAKEVRKLSTTLPITLITRDGGECYSKPVLSNAITQGKTPDLIPTHDAETMAKDYDITVRTRTDVTAIHADTKTLETSHGDVTYDNLVLCLGADQIHLPFKGDAADRVQRVNDLDAYRDFRNNLPQQCRVSIVGAGLIGCEFANDLAANGYHVDVIDLADTPLKQLLPSPLSTDVKTALEPLGVTWHLDTSIKSINPTNNGAVEIQLTNQQVLHADVILSAVGLAPRTALAKQAGLATHRGILTNDRLQTSDPHIFAIGDCAETSWAVRPYVMPMLHSARSLAKSLCGHPTAVTFPAMPIVIKTPACPVVCAGELGPSSRWVIEGTEGNHSATLRDHDNKLIAFALSGHATQQKTHLLEHMGKTLEPASLSV